MSAVWREAPLIASANSSAETAEQNIKVGWQPHDSGSPDPDWLTRHGRGCMELLAMCRAGLDAGWLGGRALSRYPSIHSLASAR
jgi:hypothetical protein